MIYLTPFVLILKPVLEITSSRPPNTIFPRAPSVNRNHLTNLSDEAKSLIRERDVLRTSNPTNPNMKLMEAQLADTISSDNRRRWRTELDSFSHRQDSGRLWQL